jgi:hypothetical protein
MESFYEEASRQISLFPEREFPEMGVEGHWLDFPYAWVSLDAGYLRFCAEYLHRVNFPLHDSREDLL